MTAKHEQNKDSDRQAKVDRRKARKPQPYTVSDRQLRVCFLEISGCNLGVVT